MAILKHIRRIKFINQMIKQKSTGDLACFAKKNGLSRSAMAETIQEMKELGFPIKFDRKRGTYYYDQSGEMVEHLFMLHGQILSKDEISSLGDPQKFCFSEITVFKLCEE